MAYARTASLLFVSWAVLATAAFATRCCGMKVHKLKYYEQGESLHDVTRVFGLRSDPWRKGQGNVISSVLTKTNDSDSQVSAFITGLAVCNSDTVITEVFSIRFTDFEGDGTLKGSKLFLHGLLVAEEQSQDYAVTGGSGEFVGAYGLLSFVPVPGPGCYGCRWMEGTVFVPDLTCLADAGQNTILKS